MHVVGSKLFTSHKDEAPVTGYTFVTTTIIGPIRGQSFIAQNCYVESMITH